MRVMLVDDTQLLRDVVATLLQDRGLDIVALAGSGREAVALAEQARPDLVLMDVRMPGMSGLEATRAIKERHPETRVVMLSASDEDGDLMESVKAGADGYLLKNITSGEFFEAIERLKTGESVISKPLTRKLIDEFRRQAANPGQPATRAILSQREVEVLQLVATGCSNREVAARLVISENTVKYHMKQILQKVGAENRAQAVAWASRHISLSAPAGNLSAPAGAASPAGMAVRGDPGLRPDYAAGDRLPQTDSFPRSDRPVPGDRSTVPTPA